MNGRERMEAILSKQPVDRLAWTTLVDGNTLNGLPDGMQGMSVMDFYITRIQRANFILCLGADGICVSLERFQAVAECMNHNGALI